MREKSYLDGAANETMTLRSDRRVERKIYSYVIYILNGKETVFFCFPGEKVGKWAWISKCEETKEAQGKFLKQENEKWKKYIEKEYYF